MSDNIEKKSKEFKPDFGSAVLALLISNLIQQQVLEDLTTPNDEPKLPEIKMEEIRNNLKESRNLITRALKHSVPMPDMPDEK